MAEIKDEELTSGEMTTVAEGAGEVVYAMRKVRDKLKQGLRALSDEQLDDLLERKIFEEADPATIVRACAAYIDHLREERPGPIDDEELANNLGYLLALGMQQRLGWRLAFVSSPAMPGGSVAVVSPDRALMAYPAMAVYRLLIAPEKANNVQLAVNMLASGEAPPSEPSAYVTVLG